MSICNKSFAAVQYAVWSAWFGLTRVVAGSFSGMAADQFGCTTYAERFANIGQTLLLVGVQ